jgi:hypothetical protein
MGCVDLVAPTQFIFFTAAAELVPAYSLMF